MRKSVEQTVKEVEKAFLWHTQTQKQVFKLKSVCRGRKKKKQEGMSGICTYLQIIAIRERVK